MGTYDTMSKNANANISDINTGLSDIKSVSFDGVWSGDAYNAQSEGLTAVIAAADTAKSDLQRFSEVLALLENYKALKEEIDRLTAEIDSITIPSDPQLAAAASARKSSLIAKRDQLITKKNQLRQTIESMLATFKPIESQIEVISFDLNQYKDYLDYIEDLNIDNLTPEAAAFYYHCMNLLPKNNSDIAHRGLHNGGIRENSLEAFIAAGEAGFWGAEADVRFDANGNLVCSHNAVKNGENPTSFSEYLDICKQYGMTAIIDLKYANGITRNPDTALSPAVIKLIKEKGMLDSCVIQTNHTNDIPYIRSQSDDVRIWYLTDNVSDNTVRVIEENNVECINIKSDGSNAEQIKRLDKLTDKDVDVCVWNVFGQDTKNRLLSKGATYIMSDNVLGIRPYQEGDVDFNSVQASYVNNSTEVNTSPSQFYDNYNSATNGTKTAPAGSYNGPILLANQGRLNYLRTDGVTVQESWCDISLKNAPELAAFYHFDGEKVVEGTKIKDMEYWVRDDGVQMIGDYVAVATDVIARKSYGVKDNMAGWQGGTYNYGDVVETTLGKGIVMGICTEAQRLRRVNGDDFTNLEVYTLWNNSPYSSTVRARDYVPTNYANDPLLKYQ